MTSKIPSLSKSQRQAVAEYLTEWAVEHAADFQTLRDLFMWGWRSKGFGEMNTRELLAAVIEQDCARIQSQIPEPRPILAEDVLTWLRSQRVI